MTVTDEPGYYEDGSFGIRIESCLVVKEEKTRCVISACTAFSFSFSFSFAFSVSCLSPVPSFSVRTDQHLLRHNFGGGTYLGFENLTFVPIQRKLIDIELLSEKERCVVMPYNCVCSLT